MDKNNNYRPSDFGKMEVELVRTFQIQKEDARLYFVNCIKPRLDRSYKLYIADNRDRAAQIQKWQANVSVPYAQAVVETLKPRILDARPEFTVQGRNADDQISASRIQSLCDYTWEISKADKTSEDVVSSALIYGTGFMQVSWKKDVREQYFLKTKDLSKDKYNWQKEERVFYDAPFVEWVDNYSLWYDWHNSIGESKQYWMKRLILTEADIKRRYPMANKKKLEMAFNKSGDLTDYGSIRQEVKLSHDGITKGADYGQTGSGVTQNIYKDSELKMHEVFEWLRPFEDVYCVMVNDVPVLKNSAMPNPYDFKETTFIGVPYLKLPGEYEGYGIPMILENPQIMLNMIKNQRLDAMTLNIHKMWIVNPLANINKDELIARPFGIVYSTDPNGAREIQMSDIKPSSYREEELLKSDMRYSSGVDDFSMGNGGGGASATEVRHLRESTLERVRLFVNHLGEGYSTILRYWISMYRQFFTDKMIIRITGDNGQITFPIIQKDDLLGEYDFKASVNPSIAGQNDIKKKQDMDLFQLLVTLPFVDPEKLTSKVLYDWNWNLESIRKNESGEQMGMGEQVSEEGLDENGMPIQPEELQSELPQEILPRGSQIPPDIAEEVMRMLGGDVNPQSPMSELSRPVNLLQGNTPPPTPKGVPAPSKTTNPRGLNRKVGGKVNTNIPLSANANPESSLMNRALNIQR